MTHLRSKLSYANVMASIAVFAALGGGAFAATIKADKDSVVSSSIKNGKVKSADLKDGGVGTNDIAGGAVTTAHLLDGDVSAADLGANSVGGSELTDGEVGSADITDDGVTSADLTDNGVTGTDIDENTLSTVPDADELDGLDGERYLSYNSVMPSGTTVRGVWGGREYGADNAMVQDYSFPMASAQALGDDDVNFAAGGTAGNIGSDDDASCTGNVSTPTAPPGKVCIYLSDDGLLGSAASAQGQSAGAARRGFQVRGPSNAVGDVEAHGSWAYTTP